MADLGLGVASARPIATRRARSIPLRAALAYPFALVSGVVYFLGFPGVNLWPLAFVSHVPLLLALRGQTPRRAAGLGMLAGFAISVTGFYWLFGMLQVFSGFPMAACVVLGGLICVQQGGRTALLGWLYARATSRGWPGAPVFALAFVASELLYPLLFPWYFGASVHNAPVLLQVADLGGPYLVGLVLLGSNLALGELVLARLEGRVANRRVVAIGFALPVFGTAYGAIQLRRVDALAAAAPAIRVGIAQGNQPLIGRHYALETHLRLTEQLKKQGAELVVWSEGAVPSTYDAKTYAADLRESFAGELGLPAIFGAAIERDADGERAGAMWNSALLTDAGGEVRGRYDKQFLLAFGEYLPFGDTFPALYEWSPNSGHMTRGTSIEPLPLGAHRITAFICYEDILPSFVNDAVRHGDPDLLVNLTNDSWFGDTTEPLEHLALAQLRAVEHRRYLVRATNSGISAIVDATGRLVATGAPFREDAFVGTARFMRARTVYEAAGDTPFYACALAIGAMAFVKRRRTT